MLQPRTTVSIIIVVKNDRGIAETLEQLHAAKIDRPFEVIVVDASEPKRLGDIRHANKWVRWEQFPVSDQRTTPMQRNRGIELAKGEIIVFIDANCIPAEGWLQAIVSSIDAGEAIVCGPVTDLGKNNFVHYATSDNTVHYVNVCTTIGVGIRRDVFERIGSFDESFKFGQDIDFFWRARDSGYKIYYNPAAAIGHHWGNSNEQLKRAFEYGKARAHLFKKHWHTRRNELLSESHVWLYPLFILGLPITIFVHIYPLLLLVPAIKNLAHNPFGLVTHHLAYGLGVIAGVLMLWPN